MGNSAGLSGGTVQVDNGTTGLFQIGAGFSTGQVNVLSGGIAEADTTGTIVSNLRLQGGTLRGGTLQVGTRRPTSSTSVRSCSTTATSTRSSKWASSSSRAPRGTAMP